MCARTKLQRPNLPLQTAHGACASSVYDVARATLAASFTAPTASAIKQRQRQQSRAWLLQAQQSTSAAWVAALLLTMSPFPLLPHSWWTCSQ